MQIPPNPPFSLVVLTFSRILSINHTRLSLHKTHSLGASGLPLHTRKRFPFTPTPQTHSVSPAPPSLLPRHFPSTPTNSLSLLPYSSGFFSSPLLSSTLPPSKSLLSIRLVFFIYIVFVHINQVSLFFPLSPIIFVNFLPLSLRPSLFPTPLPLLFSFSPSFTPSSSSFSFC